MNRFFFCFLTIIASILSTYSYAKTVVVMATNEELGAVGLSSTKIDIPGGTVIVDSEVGSLELAYDDSWGVTSIIGEYSTVKVGDSEHIFLGRGAVGNTNPAFTSYENGVMSAGAVFKIKAKQDGWMTVFTKMNPGKQYVVFEGTTGAVPFTLGVAGDGYKINYTMPIGSDGYIDFEATDASKYLTLALTDEGIILGHKPEFPYIVAGLETAPAQSLGFLTFKVSADRIYYVSALGSKMTCGGFVFSDSKNEPAVTFAANESLPEVKFETRKSDEPQEQSQVPTPTASFKNKLLTLSCSDKEAEIYYAIDGEVTASSSVYDSPLSLTKDCTVKFFAARQGYKDSEKDSFVFKKSDYQVAKPTINYDPDTKLISISCQTKGAQIRYTTDGTEPTNSTGTEYKDPFVATGNLTYIAKAFHSDLFDSEPVSRTINDFQVPTPTATFQNKLLTLSCSDTEAKIYYAIDGEVTASSSVYDSPLSLTKDCTVKFFAARQGYKDSEINTFEFKKSDYQVAKPILNYDPESRLMSITCQTKGAQIRYTTDGSVPTNSTGTVYTEPFAVTGNLTYIAKAFHSELFDSEEASETVSDYKVPNPTATFENLLLTLSCSDKGAQIYYSIDGSEPTVYESPISLTSDCTVTFYAVREGCIDSEIVTFNFIKANYQVAKPSITFDEYSRTLTISCPTEGANIYYTTDGTEPTVSSNLYAGPISVESNIHFGARAYKEGLFESEVTYFSLAIDQVVTPTASFSSKKLTLSCSDSQAQIYYMIESSTSAKDWTLYDNDNPLELYDDCTINFYAKRDGYNDSETASFKFILAEHQVSLPVIENDFHERKITITHAESLPVKLTIDGITDKEERQTPVTIDVSTSMTSIAAIAIASDEDHYDSNMVRESIRFHKKPDVTYNGHTLTVSVAKDDPIEADAEVECKFKDNIIGQGSNKLEIQISDFGNVYATVVSDKAFCSAQEERTIDVFNTGRVAGAKNEHTLSEAFGTWGDNLKDYTYLRIVGEVNKEDLQLLATLPNLTTLHFDHSLMTTDRCDNIFANTKIETIYFANSFPEGILLGMPRLTTVLWGKTNYGMNDGLLSEANNPNILLWVNKKENAPKDATNIVIFQDPGDGKATDPLVSDVQGTAETINLQVGYPFNVHKSIKVAEINVEKDFTLPTQKGVTQGWETLILPFEPKVISHETKGTLVAFKAWDSTNVDTKPFWLYEATESGWEEADKLEAFKPYVISMPNNPVYMDAFNLPGKVTFSAKDIELSPKSMELKPSSWVNSIEFAGTFMPVEEPNILSLNVNAPNEDELRGSEFVDYDVTLPFGAYVRNVGDMKRIPLFGEGSGVEFPSFESDSLKIETPAPGMIRLYSSCRINVCIYTTTGIMVRSVNLAPGEPVEIENLTKGIYICNGVKVMVI